MNILLIIIWLAVVGYKLVVQKRIRNTYTRYCHICHCCFFFAVFNISPKINKMIQHFKMCKNENANRNQINKTKCSLKLKWKETPSPALQNNAVFWFSLIVYYMGCTSQLHNVLKFRDFNFKERWHKDIASVLRCLRSWIRPTILS